MNTLQCFFFLNLIILSFSFAKTLGYEHVNTKTSCSAVVENACACIHVCVYVDPNQLGKSTDGFYIILHIVVDKPLNLFWVWFGYMMLMIHKSGETLSWIVLFAYDYDFQVF